MKQIKNIVIALVAVVLVASGCIKETFPQTSTVTVTQAANAPGAFDNFVDAVTSSLCGTFTYGGSKCLKSRRTSAVARDEHIQKLSVQLVKAEFIYLHASECDTGVFLRYLCRYCRCIHYLRIVTHPFEKPVGYTGSPS